jgi:hypothetical protein
MPRPPASQRTNPDILRSSVQAEGKSFTRKRSATPHEEKRQTEMRNYLVRHLAGGSEEQSCFAQLEDESAAMYFNIIHGAKLRRRFTTEGDGKACDDYLLIARDLRSDGSTSERAIALFDLT